MKQDQQSKKGIISALLVLLILTGSIFAKEAFTNRKNGDDKVSASKILETFKLDPTFKKYFENTKNPNLVELLKTSATKSTISQIDSLVSVAYDTAYQKMKISYEFDENGNLTNYLGEIVKNGVKNYFTNYQFEFRPDGQLKSGLSLNWRNGIWINNSKETHIFNPNGNEITVVYEDWDTTTTSWINDSKHEYTYDVNQNMTLDVAANWSGGVWENTRKYLWTYDANNNQTSEIELYWSSGAWVNTRRYEWTYDVNHNLTSEIFVRWRSDAWENSDKEEYTYDGNNNLISSNAYEWSTTTSTWENYEWFLYTYNVNNNITFENGKAWDSGTSSWIDDFRTNFTYNASGIMISLLEEEWDGAIWVNVYEQSYVFDGNNKLVSAIMRETWNGSGWDEGQRWNYTYDDDGQCNGGNFETWFTNHWVSADNFLIIPNYWMSTDENLFWELYYVIGYEFNIYYENTTAISDNNEVPTSFKLEQNYPNPFNPSTKISYQLPSTGHVSLKVFDILGNEVATLVNENQNSGAYNVNFNASNLTSGIYFYKIMTANFSQVHKMMLLK